MKKEESIQVFLHLLYEYDKGLRDLALFTGSSSLIDFIEKKLKKMGVSYLMQPVTEEKTNVFFGKESAVEVVTSFGNKRLNRYTPEEDFILGIMLGYSRTEQCKRYLNIIKSKQETLSSFGPVSLN